MNTNNRLCKLKAGSYNYIKYYKNSSWLTNSRVCFGILETKLKSIDIEVLSFKDKKIQMSPYSISMYINISPINSIDDSEIYQIRISNHYCNNYSPQNVLDLTLCSNGQFYFNKLNEKIMMNNISDYRKKYFNNLT